MEEFIREAGHDPNDLSSLGADAREQLMRAASAYASAKLVEVEARSHFLDEIRGDAE